MTGRAIISRANAKSLGLKTYFTGIPCSRGGIADRKTVDGQCQCDHCKAFRAPKQQVRSKRHRENNREGLKESKRIYFIENREAITARMRSYCQKNSASVRESKRRYHLANRDAIVSRVSRWRNDNPEKLGANQSRRRAAKQLRLPTWFGEFDEFVIEEAYDLAVQRARATGIVWHVDHMVPLLARKASGLHCGYNLQVIPAYLNLRKGNKLWLHEPDQWIAHLNR